MTLLMGVLAGAIGEYVGEDSPYLPGKVLYLTCSVNADCGPGTLPTRQRLRASKAHPICEPKTEKKQFNKLAKRKSIRVRVKTKLLPEARRTFESIKRLSSPLLPALQGFWAGADAHDPQASSPSAPRPLL